MGYDIAKAPIEGGGSGILGIWVTYRSWALAWLRSFPPASLMSAPERTDPLFEAFFWLQAFRPDDNSVSCNFPSHRRPPPPHRCGVLQAYQSKVMWHSPDNVTHITKEHKDIPFYCFPGEFVASRRLAAPSAAAQRSLPWFSSILQT